MSRLRSRPIAAGLIAFALVLGGCGGGEDDEAPASPGANVDPTSDNIITGPINKAKKTAEQQKQRDQQVEQTGSDY